MNALATNGEDRDEEEEGEEDLDGEEEGKEEEKEQEEVKNKVLHKDIPLDKVEKGGNNQRRGRKMKKERKRKKKEEGDIKPTDYLKIDEGDEGEGQDNTNNFTINDTNSTANKITNDKENKSKESYVLNDNKAEENTKNNKKNKLNDIKSDSKKSNKENRRALSEAMADDDVLADFLEEKKKIEERDQIKDYRNLTFEDMGHWVGPTIKHVERKKRKRDIIKAAKLKRKDEGMSAVILSEVKDDSIAKHQVNRLPFRFNNVSKFEDQIKRPIGKLWLKDIEYWKKIRPPVSVKMGQVIEPINRSNLIDTKTKEEKEIGKNERKKVKSKKPVGRKRKFPKLVVNDNCKKSKKD